MAFNTGRKASAAKDPILFRPSHGIIASIEAAARLAAAAAMKAEAPHLFQDRKPVPPAAAVRQLADAERRSLLRLALEALVKARLGEDVHCLPFAWKGASCAVACFRQRETNRLVVEVGFANAGIRTIGKPAFPVCIKKKRPRRF